MTSMQILTLLAPVMVVGVALLAVLLARWQDAREDRRRAAKGATTHRP